MNAKRLLAGCALAALTLLSACGGGEGTSTPKAQPAVSLSYTDPSGTGWRLVRNARESTPARLVLNLVGPAGLKVWGIGFTLKANPDIRFGKFDDGKYLFDEGVLKLSIAPDDPKLIAAGVRGDQLMVGIFQKGGPTSGAYSQPGAYAQDFGQEAGQSLVRIAIELPELRPASGTSVPMQVTKAKVMISKIALEDTPIAVGKLTLN